MRSFLVKAVGVGVASGTQSPPASAATGRDAVIAAVLAFFDAMAAKDVAAAQRTIDVRGALPRSSTAGWQACGSHVHQ